MFIISLKYKASLEEIDANMKEHMAFLNQYYEKNVFVVSGRKVPRTGGIILALAGSPEEIDLIMQEDPFIAKGLAEYDVTEFLTSQSHPALKPLLKSR